MKKIIRILICIIIAIIILVGVYVAYVFIAYHRIGDNMALSIEGKASEAEIKTGTEQTIVSWNIGFGAYEDDYGFFMDGGTQTWSKERLTANLEAIAGRLAEQKADIYLIQEVDYNSTRSYHVDEREYVKSALPGFSSTFAVNYDSPFLFYPITQPHGASKAGIMTFSKYGITWGLRRELPIEITMMKFLDLDRCYSVSRVPAEGGKELVLYNFHLSAYTSDGSIATEQLKMLLADMQEEYNKGNYCIAGGDFNKDILGDSSVYFGKSDIEYTWAQPIPAKTFDGYDMKLVAPLDEASPVPSCRNADGPYRQGQYVLTIDGFLISPNVEMKDANVFDYGFKYSDHNPVYMTFELK